MLTFEMSFALIIPPNSSCLSPKAEVGGRISAGKQFPAAATRNGYKTWTAGAFMETIHRMRQDRQVTS